MKNKKKGFTLVELLVVIAILAVLASVSVVGYIGFKNKADQSKCVSELKQVQTLILGDCADDGMVKDSSGNVQITYDHNNKTLTVTDLNAAFVACFPNDKLEGTLSYDVTKKEVTYTYNEQKATWNLDTNLVQ